MRKSTCGDAGETPFGTTAVEKLLDRAPRGLSEPGMAVLDLLLVDADEGLEVVLDEPIERCLLRPARPVGGERGLSFILDPDVTTAILRHLRRAGRDPRALPEHAAARHGRDPP